MVIQTSLPSSSPDWVCPGLTDTHGGVLATSTNFLTWRAVSWSVSAADRQGVRAEPSMIRWLSSTRIDWPMVTGEGHVVALENGVG